MSASSPAASEMCRHPVDTSSASWTSKGASGVVVRSPLSMLGPPSAPPPANASVASAEGRHMLSRTGQSGHPIGRHRDTMADMASGTLITVAPTGAESAKSDVPALPVTVEEMVGTAKACEAAGAAVIHVHLRDADARPTLDVARGREVVEAI